MKYITVRQTRMVNANGNDMGNVFQGVTFAVENASTKEIKGVIYLLVSINRYIPLKDVKLTEDIPPVDPPVDPPIDPPIPTPTTGAVVKIRYGNRETDGAIVWNDLPKQYEEIADE